MTSRTFLIAAVATAGSACFAGGDRGQPRRRLRAGLDAGDFDIELHEGRLSITGERTTETMEEGQTLRRAERHFGKFQRTFQLGNDVDAEKVSATYNAGVLRVVVEKTALAQPKKIEVK